MKTLTINFLLFWGIGCLALTSCKKRVILDDGMADPVMFVLRDKQGRNLIRGPQTLLKVSAYDPSGKSYQLHYSSNSPSPFVKNDSTVTFPFPFVYWSKDIGVDSSIGTKDFYLELNNKTDTLHYDVQQTAPRPGSNQVQYPVLSVLFNGKPVQTTYSPGGSPCYILQRQR